MPKTPEEIKEDARLRSKAWYYANLDRAKQTRKAWRANNLEKQKALHSDWLKRHPGRQTELHKKWRHNNPDKFKATQDAYKARHAEQLAESDRKRRARNAEKHKAYMKVWNRDNIDKVRSYLQQRRATQLGVDGSVTDSEIRKLWQMQKGRCAYFSVCGNALTGKGEKGVHRDHIEPLRPREPHQNPGRHILENIQLLCSSCNHKKSNRDPYVFTQQHEGRLFPDLPRQA